MNPTTQTGRQMIDGAALLVIDVQQGLDDPGLGMRSTPDAEANIANLLAAWRGRGWPVVHVQHDSTEPDSKLRPELPGNACKPEARPVDGETVFRKQVNSAFIGTGLESHLKACGISALVVAGLTTDHCVSTSVRMAANLGFDVVLAADACAAFERRGYDGEHYTADAVHRLSLVTLQDEFCTVLPTTDILAAARGV